MFYIIFNFTYFSLVSCCLGIGLVAVVEFVGRDHSLNLASSCLVMGVQDDAEVVVSLLRI